MPITRLARGLASGSVLEFANKEMLADALLGRQRFSSLSKSYGNKCLGGRGNVFVPRWEGLGSCGGEWSRGDRGTKTLPGHPIKQPGRRFHPIEFRRRHLDLGRDRGIIIAWLGIRVAWPWRSYPGERVPGGRARA